MINWTLKILPVNDLKSHSKNPRKIDKEKFQRLGQLINKFGLIDKPIINLDMTIIGGHQRIKFLKKEKVKTVECWVPDRLLDEKEVEELMIGVNKIHGQFDYDMLANEFDTINLLEWGFSEKELFELCKTAEEITNAENIQQNKKTKTCPSCGCEF